MHPESQASATVMPQGEEARAYLEQLATQITYGGNLSTSAILGTSGCNRLANPGRVKPYATKQKSLRDAQSLLRAGARRGLVSVQERGGWPQNVWAIAANGVAVEAMLENPLTGQYHGYPMLESDPLVDEVREP